jgi:hypothetical protein
MHNKNFPQKKKTKITQSMNNAIHFEHRASSSQSKHEGESSFALCDRLSRTRDNSQRQLPTDHDYAVPTREYQTDQSSLKSAQAAARSVLEKKQRQRQLQKLPHYLAELTRSLHIRAMHSVRCDIALFQVPSVWSPIRNVWSAAVLQAKNESDRLVCANVSGLCWSSDLLA